MKPLSSNVGKQASVPSKHRHLCLLSTRLSVPLSHPRWTSHFLRSGFENEVTKWLEAPLALVVSGLRATGNPGISWNWMGTSCLLAGWSTYPVQLPQICSDEDWIVMGDSLVPRSLLMGLVGINPGHLSEPRCCRGNCQIMSFLLDWKRDGKPQNLEAEGQGNLQWEIYYNTTKFIIFEVSDQDLVWPLIYSESLGRGAMKCTFCQKRMSWMPKKMSALPFWL